MGWPVGEGKSGLNPKWDDLFVLCSSAGSSYPLKPPNIMTTQSKNSQFLLLFRHSPEGPDPTPEEMQKIMGRWMDWMKGMGAKGVFAGANRLQESGKVLRGPRGASVTDGPFVEAKEVVGGYVIVSAANYAQAVELARGCPGLEMGTIVEVREVEPLPEM